MWWGLEQTARNKPASGAVYLYWFMGCLKAAQSRRAQRLLDPPTLAHCVDKVRFCIGKTIRLIGCAVVLMFEVLWQGGEKWVGVLGWGRSLRGEPSLPN